MTTLDEALRALEKDLREEVALLRDMEGSCEHEQGIAIRAAAAMAESCAYKLAALLTTRQEVAPVAWMIPMIVSFKNAVRTSCPADLQDEIEGTVAWDAKVGQWCDCGPVVDKHGVEHHPTPLYTSTGQTSDARDAVVTDAMVMAALDAQPLTDENESWRIWQIIGFDDARAKKIMRSALVAAMEASR